MLCSIKKPPRATGKKADLTPAVDKAVSHLWFLAGLTGPQLKVVSQDTSCKADCQWCLGEVYNSNMMKKSRDFFRSSSRLPISIAIVCLLSISTLSLASAPAAPDSAPSIIVIYEDDTMAVSDFHQLAKDGHAPSDIDVVNERLIEVHLPKGADARKAVKSALDNPSVVAAAENRLIEALSSPPNDPRYPPPITGQHLYLGPTTFSAHSIGLESVWRITRDETSGFAMNRHRRGVTMAIIDTGVSIPLMEDTGRFVPVLNNVAPTPSANTSDDSISFHGTAVASVIAANTNNDFAIAGTLYDLDSSILVYKALDSRNEGYRADIIAAMMDAADRGARVINASFGDRATITVDGQPMPDQNARDVWQAAVDYCIAKGALVVAASGNDSSLGKNMPVLYPAACEGALAVGSIDFASGQRSEFSNSGPELDVVAAGQRIWTVRPSGDTTQANGTSFATPLVAGSIAYLWSLVPDLTPEEMLSFAQTTAVGTYGSDPGFDDETGFGRFDSYRLFEHMQQAVAIQNPVTLSVGPHAQNSREVRLTWSAAEGQGVFYLYGYEGGSAYRTTSTSGRLVLPASGPNTVWVRSFASDRWSAQQPTTASVNVTAGSHPINSLRLEGANRFRTALAISQASFPATSASVVIASGENWPDGLAGGTLASVSNGPLLLTRASRLSLEVRDEILRLRPQRIYILGGSGAISPAVESAIRSLPITGTVERLQGHDRYATAARIANRVRDYTRSVVSGQANRVIVASGENFPDALAGSALAASARIPILLTRRSALTTSTEGALRAIMPYETLVLGGEGVISKAVHDRLPRPHRIWGANRYETSRKIAEYGRSGSRPLFDANRLGFATGTTFPDALAAGQLLGGRRTPIVLTDQATAVRRDLTVWLRSPGHTIGNVTFLGGSGAIGYDLEFEIRNALLR